MNTTVGMYKNVINITDINNIKIFIYMNKIKCRGKYVNMSENMNIHKIVNNNMND